ncbi:hypothetical protein GSH19_03140 [Lactobacillus sp. S2-2]|uniref:hypothetical protein n=1 Tax=Lactobacillus sp. S2-2 TaxID=2692917 RepID=UPI001F454C79|nr:hypothetical protein [Lactobacillus sp. S2-2]MCF6515160.1 hypothetical protein [Lactobacillus sp. S2-2]
MKLKNKQFLNNKIHKNIQKLFLDKFSNQEIYGFWINYESINQNQYNCGINIKKDNTFESYNFLYDKKKNKLFINQC